MKKRCSAWSGSPDPRRPLWHHAVGSVAAWRRSTYRVAGRSARRVSAPPCPSRNRSAVNAATWWPACASHPGAGHGTPVTTVTGGGRQPGRGIAPPPRSCSPAVRGAAGGQRGGVDRNGADGAGSPEWPDDETLKPSYRRSVRALLGVLRHWSGWPDSNRRPPRPKRGALAQAAATARTWLSVAVSPAIGDRRAPFMDPVFRVRGGKVVALGQQAGRGRSSGQLRSSDRLPPPSCSRMIEAGPGIAHDVADDGGHAGAGPVAEVDRPVERGHPGLGSVICRDSRGPVAVGARNRVSSTDPVALLKIASVARFIWSAIRWP